MGVAAIGFMIGTGGSAIVSKTLGGKPDKANEYFSLLIYTAIGISVTLSILGFIFIKPISVMLGASGELLENCIVYGRILFVSMPAFIFDEHLSKLLYCCRKAFSEPEGVPAGGNYQCHLGLYIYRRAEMGHRRGCMGNCRRRISRRCDSNDLLSQKERHSCPQLTKTTFNGRILLKAFTNGSSEMVTNLSLSIVGVLYNFQLMRLAGEDGVAAYGIIMYVNFIFMAIFFGYSIGTRSNRCLPIWRRQPR